MKGADNNLPFLCQLFSPWQQVVIQMDNSFTIWCLIPHFYHFCTTYLIHPVPQPNILNNLPILAESSSGKKNKGYSNIKPIKSALYIYTYFGVFLFLERKILKWRICRLLFMFFHNLMIVLKRKLPCHTTNFKNWPYMDINIIVTNDLNVCDLRRLSCLYALHLRIDSLYLHRYI